MPVDNAHEREGRRRRRSERGSAIGEGRRGARRAAARRAGRARALHTERAACAAARDLYWLARPPLEPRTTVIRDHRQIFSCIRDIS
jgi:hypothetical protein